MKQESKQNQVLDAIHRLWKQYPTYTATFGPCVNGCMDMLARGSGACASCCERDLAALVGLFAASRYHQSVRELRKMESEMMENLDSSNSG